MTLLVLPHRLWQLLISTSLESSCHLGLEESAAKSCPPSPVMTCLGVAFNTMDFNLSVDLDCVAEIERLLHTWLHKRTTKSSLQSLVGKLVFVSKCVRQN